jgi:hypothetical protein
MDDKSIPFVLTDELSLSFSASLKKHVGQQKILNSSFSPDILNECPRRILYKVEGYYEFNYLAQETKIANKSKWLSIFKRCVGIRVVDSNVCASSVDYQISGYLDAVLEISNTIMATQIKSVSNEIFIKIKDKGALKKDVMEVMIFLWMMELENGLILYENLQDHEFLSFHIKPHMPMINLIKEKCNKLIVFQREKKITDRVYKSSSEKECSVCEFSKKCWG